MFTEDIIWFSATWEVLLLLFLAVFPNTIFKIYYNPRVRDPENVRRAPGEGI